MKQFYLSTIIFSLLCIVSCKKEQQPVHLTDITLSKDSINVLIGSQATLTASPVPSNAVDGALTFSSSNETIATVTKLGLITGISLGTASIIVQNSSGSIIKECLVSVVPINVSKIILNQDSLSMIIGTLDTLTASILPANATFNTVSWGSSNPSIATINDSGVIQAVASGSIVITAYSKDGTTMASCKVKVGDMNSFLYGTVTYTLGSTGNGDGEYTSFSLKNNSMYPLNITSWNYFALTGQELTGQQFPANSVIVNPMTQYNSLTLGISFAGFDLPDQFQEFNVYIYFLCAGKS